MAKKRLIIIGGGAAGCFAAIQAAENGGNCVEVTLLEGGRELLSKVRISGGGRCNVTHACFDPALLVQNYPRGNRELRGPFHQFQPSDMIQWLKIKGIELKTEEDGRMFPVTDQSSTIIDCFHQELRRLGVRCLIGKRVSRITKNGLFSIETVGGQTFHAEACLVAVGGLQRSPLLSALESMGHTLTPLAPSLFTFHIQDPRIQGLAGVSVPEVGVSIEGLPYKQSGPLLITHRGMSGPAILKLSAWAARELAEKDYRFLLKICWSPSEVPFDSLLENNRKRYSKKKVRNTPLPGIPNRLWEQLLQAVDKHPNVSGQTSLLEITWAHLSHQQAIQLKEELLSGEFNVSGKSMNKEEFVTCGGVDLSEVDFRTMESKIIPNLYFAGECLDIDGVTGGFNFQAAWTTGYLAGTAMSRENG